MQRNTTIRYHSILTTMVKIKNTNIAKCWRGYGVAGTLLYCMWHQNITTTLEKFSVLYNLNIHLSYTLAITPLISYPRKRRTYVFTITCIQITLAELFILKNLRRTPRFITWWTGKQITIYSYNRTLLNNRTDCSYIQQHGEI